MCGIAGYMSFDGRDYLPQLENGIRAMRKRGPDVQKAVRADKHVGLAHARLSIIDVSDAGTQPMIDHSGRYQIIFNGEIFNYRELKATFLSDLSHFQSASDTEVLLNMYIRMGADCLQHLNGFFAFVVFDSVDGTLFFARDRMGIKPLHLYRDERFLLFASELKPFYHFPIKKEIDRHALSLYLQLNYLPGEHSILQNVKRLKPGHFMKVYPGGKEETGCYYQIPYREEDTRIARAMGYEAAKKTFRELMDASVKRRLVADVPLGAFLSGGIDSSVVVSLAAKHVKGLNTFSIGFKDEPYFDETYYANLVAKKYGTNHTVFSISTEEMFGNIHDILEYFDEPFADSSAIAVYILSQKTRQKVTVSLSGDGGDELFAGYNKHKAERQARQSALLNSVISAGMPILSVLPKSRNSKFGNLFRQAHRYAEGIRLGNAERYWRWCTFSDQTEALSLLKNFTPDSGEIQKRKEAVLQYIHDNGPLNEILLADTQMVLPNDMLTKVDLMSMANSLEVRVPFLDYTVVNFAFSLPEEFKINQTTTKRIVKEAFKEDLPAELFTRPKSGFEVPLLKWLRTGLNSMVHDDLLEDGFIEQQGIFNLQAIRALKQQLHSNNPGEVHARIWGLLVFQYWYKKYFI